MLSPKNINDRKFEKGKVFGYKTDDVDLFMDEVRRDYEIIYNERIDLESKVNFLADKLSEYRMQENKLTDVLIEAKKVSDNMIKKSKLQAETIISEAKSSVDKMLEDAKKEVENKQILLLKLQKEVNAFKSKVLGLYKSHIDLISNFPDVRINNDVEKLMTDVNISLNEDIKCDNINDESIKDEKKLKERTLSISLDENGKPVEIKEYTDFDTKNISLSDIKDMRNNKIDDNESAQENRSKFGEPLKFGAAYSLKNDRKSKKIK